MASLLVTSLGWWFVTLSKVAGDLQRLGIKRSHDLVFLQVSIFRCYCQKQKSSRKLRISWNLELNLIGVEFLIFTHLPKKKKTHIQREFTESKTPMGHGFAKIKSQKKHQNAFPRWFNQAVTLFLFPYFWRSRKTSFERNTWTFHSPTVAPKKVTKNAELPGVCLEVQDT